MRFISVPMTCGYLPGQVSQMEYRRITSCTAQQYQELLLAGWRRFGRTMFRPCCLSCNECRSLRVDVERFHPNRSMKRLEAQNKNLIALEIEPAAGLPSDEVFDLYHRYHRDQEFRRGWQSHDDDNPDEFVESFLDNPFPAQQWLYRNEGQLIAVGYVDQLPEAISLVYCFYDPEQRVLSPGTWNILCGIEQAKRLKIPYLYLGYYVADCRSLSYKSRFTPNQLMEASQEWIDFRP